METKRIISLLVLLNTNAFWNPVDIYQKKGFKITYLPVKSDGLIDLNELESYITEKNFNGLNYGCS